MSYYNTNQEQGSTLQESEFKALKQDDAVLDVFRCKSYLSWTPEWILTHLKLETPLAEHDRWVKTPITSIRRSFTNLKNRGLIEKTDNMVKGDYGKLIHTWKLTK